MADGTKISWCDATVSPLPGCGRKLESLGCGHCWAVTMARRLEAMKTRGYEGLTERGAWTGRHGWVPSELAKLRAWKRPRVVFVNSMGDLSADGVADWQLALVFAGMELAPQHSYLLLTKRPERMRAWSLVRDFPANVWAGVSVCTQDDADRFLPDLLQTASAHRWISAEPMLEPLDLSWLWEQGDGGPLGIDQIVIGCESGPRARQCGTDWVRDLVAQGRNAEIAVYVKQLSAFTTGRAGRGQIRLTVSHDPSEWPEDLRVRDLAWRR